MEIFDDSILSFYHSLAQSAGSVLTPAAEFISLLGEKGAVFFVLAFILMLFPKTRRSGVCIFGAVCCGALFTNFILKDIIARPRPMLANEQYRAWWQFVGEPRELGYSFPSGHATAAAAAMTALVFSEGKQYLSVSIPFVTLMCASRNYLMVHYPSDVLAGTVVGIFSAMAAFIIAKLIFVFLENYKKNRLCSFILTFDIRKPFVKNKEYNPKH